MFENRKEERNNYSSLGQIFIAGELLDFISYDISATGILIEVLPGAFLSSVDDFEKLLKDNCVAEFFVKDLMFTGEATVVRVTKKNNSILLGLEFLDVIYNAKRIWHRRRYYRKNKKVSGVMIVDDHWTINFETIDISLGGVMLRFERAPTPVEKISGSEADLLATKVKVGQVVKVLMKELNLKAIALVVWTNQVNKTLGLKYLQIEDALLNIADET